jgi:hypothetical protein
MTINNISKFTFPVGYHKFHKKQVFNFQLNRWHSFGYARFEDMKEVCVHDMQIKALTNAKSVTGRVFTKEEQAHNHCQIGNTGLALDVMLKWIDEKS